MKISRRQLRQLIKEELISIDESSAEYTQWLQQLVSPDSIIAINKRLTDLEQAVEMLGGTVISIRTRVEDIEVIEDDGEV
jgi:hypothetical protein